MVGDDALDDVEVELAVVVNRHIVEPDHADHAIRERLVEQVSVAQHLEGLARLLRDSQAAYPDHVHREIDRGLAGTLQVEDDRVLAGDVVAQPARVTRVLLADPCDAALDHGSLVQDDVIDHGPSRRAGPAAGSPDAPR